MNKLILCFILSIASFTSSMAEDMNIESLLEGFDSEPLAPQSNDPQPSVDQLLEGFDESNVTEPTIVNDDKVKFWSLDGFLNFQTSYNYQALQQNDIGDFHGLSRIRIKYFPELSITLPHGWKFFSSVSSYYDGIFNIKNANDFVKEYVNENKSELELRELHIGGSLTKTLDFKIGRQILAWGKSDTLRVVDIINPVDFREPGLVDLEDIRLPISMLRIDYYTGAWNFNFAAIPEFLAEKTPVYGSDFYPIPVQPPSLVQPPNPLSDWQLALAIRGSFNQWDLSFHFADVYEHQARFILSDQGLKHEFKRIQMAGMATNIVSGNWLFKTELAYITGLKYLSVPHFFDRYDAMLGFDFNGITDHTLSIETTFKRLGHHHSVMDNPPDNQKAFESQLAIRYSANFLRETLSVTLLALLFDPNLDIGGIYRASTTYKPADAWSVSAGAIVYQSGDNFFINGIARNDRIFFETRYDF